MLRSNLLLIMSLSGSAVVLLYGLVCLTLRKHISPGCRYFVLKLAVFFFLFPLSVFKYRIMEVIERSIPFPNRNMSQIFDTERMIIMSEGYTYVGAKVKLLWFSMLCMVLISLSIVLGYLIRYQKAKKLLLSHGTKAVPPELRLQFEKVKKQQKIFGRVRLVYSGEWDEPMAIGILKPTILFPAVCKENFGEDACDLMLRHECVHIRHGDLVIQLLGLLVIGLHWYNPLSYFLYHELLIAGELCCDRKVVGEFDEEMRRKYSNLLVDVAERSQIAEKKFAVDFLGNNKRALKRRILEMKGGGKRKTYLVVFIIMTTLLTGSLTAFAYQIPQTATLPEYHPDEEVERYYMDEENSVEPILYDSFWKGSDGTIEELPESIAQKDDFCRHVYEDGIAGRHRGKSDGGCVITEREAKKCVICSYIKTGDLINVNEYMKCLH